MNDQTYESAKSAYHEAAARLTRETEATIGRTVRAVFPEADSLHVSGEYGEEWTLRLWPLRVTVVDRILAGGGPGSEVVEHNDHLWDQLCDQLLEPLELLADLTGDDYAAGGEVPLVHHEPAPPEEPKLLLIDGQATCPRCGSVWFRYDENYPTSRKMADNQGGVLAFHGDFEWYDGDSDPGVVCEGTTDDGKPCQTELTVPDEITLEWV